MKLAEFKREGGPTGDYTPSSDLSCERGITLRTLLERAEKNVREKIESMVIGKNGQFDGLYTKTSRSKPVSRSAGLAIAAKSSTDAREMMSVVAWTKSWVLFVYEYDTITINIRKIPRNPAMCSPEFNGVMAADRYDEG